MNTYTQNNKRTLSPIQRVRWDRENAFNAQERPPIREEIEQCIGEHTLTFRVFEDQYALSTLGMDGLVAFATTLSREDGTVIGLGHGSTLLSPSNRYLQRVIRNAFHSSIVDATIQATKILGTFLGKPLEEKAAGPVATPATEKQMDYLKELLHSKVQSPVQRREIEAELPTMTKERASSLIGSLRI